MIFFFCDLLQELTLFGSIIFFTDSISGCAYLSALTFPTLFNKASITVLPVTITELESIFSFNKFSLELSVGAKCISLTAVDINLFNSSGRVLFCYKFLIQLLYDKLQLDDKMMQ